MHKPFAHFAAAALAMSVHAHSLAQDGPAVVVEATRFPTDARRVPASVTVITEADIERSAARTLPELLSEQAGFSMIDFFGNNAASTSIDLRGYGITAAQNTLILLDGQRLNDFDLSGVQWAAIPLAAIERIEILRGTGAVLYGGGASAGVVNIITRSPLRQGRRLEAFGRAAAYNTLEGQLYGSFAGESLGVNGSLHGYTSDGYRANNRNEQQNATLNLRWPLGQGALDLRFGVDRQDLRLPGGRRIRPSIGLDQYAADPRGTNTPNDYASRDGRRATATLQQMFGGVELSVGLEHREKDQRTFALLGGFSQFRADRLELDSLTPRLRVPFAWGSIGHRLTLGVDLHRWQFHSRRTLRPETLAQPINRVTVTQQVEALYLHDSIQLARGTVLELGWRVERARYGGDDTVDPTAPGFFFNTAAPQVRRTQRKDAWELGLRHALNERWSVFARAQRSLRFVNAEEIYENDAFFAAQFQVLRPQQAQTYETGGEWRAPRGRLRAALFRSNITDEIHLDPFSTGVGNTNLPPSRRQGLELDGEWKALERLRLGFAYTYIDARFREGVLAGSAFAIGTNLQIGGKRVPLVPQHKLNVAAAWDIDGRTRLSAALTAVSRQVLDNDEPNTLGVRIPAYSLVDLKLAHRLGWGRIALTLNNAFDERYYTYAVRSAFTPDLYQVYPLPGRALGVSAEILLP
jgi:iron complex outermembrane receptor protein